MSCNTNGALFPLVVCFDEDNLKYGTRIPKVTQTKSSNTISGLSR